MFGLFTKASANYTSLAYEYDFNVIQYKDHYIWGATAGMLINLYEVIMNKSK